MKPNLASQLVCNAALNGRRLARAAAAGAAAAVLAVSVAGCATKSVSNTVYDFGPLPVATAAAGAATAPAAAIPALVVADVNGPASLDSNRMYYRLLYANAQQARPYSQNAWSVTPLQLLTQRLRARLAQAGVKVLATTDAAVGMPVLRLEADNFSQNFDSQTSSSGQVSLRASLFRNHKLVDQKTFTRSTAAPSADAAGGARALAASTDAVAADILAWLAALQP